MRLFDVLWQFGARRQKHLIRLSENYVGIHIHQIETMPKFDLCTKNCGGFLTKLCHSPLHCTKRSRFPKVYSAAEPIVVVLAGCQRHTFAVQDGFRDAPRASVKPIYKLDSRPRHILHGNYRQFSTPRTPEPDRCKIGPGTIASRALTANEFRQTSQRLVADNSHRPFSADLLGNSHSTHIANPFLVDW